MDQNKEINHLSDLGLAIALSLEVPDEGLSPRAILIKREILRRKDELSKFGDPPGVGDKPLAIAKFTLGGAGGSIIQVLDPTTEGEIQVDRFGRMRPVNSPT